ncbi:DegT/DnrJ/EryC1/StrS family aminotransferase [Sporomusa acidovorans]|uniref:dTDP-3-amino-3,6-dideoxy-alpha-D-galactopyranose transaminase n=1 Tax=Sporomusa acidovorans (strain ATCC 49682 / DSM 3132 / Mol) TaxID=1123286 RepID=A0ABZ3J823_SPOA4|nr:DegT/DnrJ/EryC1/StrS family aminotransferase [Sporomusa acidovorans]OZC23481.1 dTDP-3-amino-3,6-dideoxy-alpha-D-galactopyranose transaminase [Sporomusa acidovorans DSM 3132]SDF28169.1 dTDP-4-amino-4,6-dideoxygalactose transaminase [Sporomusa acidovorans]
MRIPLIDLHQQTHTIKSSIIAKITEVLDNTSFIMGQHIQELEGNLVKLTGASHAISCNSGTDALVLILEALGIGAGDEVITTPFTFFATAESISRVGATPVFVDVDRGTFNLDPQKLEAAITPRTKAILPVHIFGQPADMEPILQIAEKHNIKVIEDACQAIGASYTFRDGTVKAAGGIGDAAAFSFYPTKNLGAFGDGGMITTAAERLATIIRGLRTHGSGLNGKKAYELLSGKTVELGLTNDGQADATIYDPTKYYNFLIGMNSRLDTIQAAILGVKLNYLSEWNRARQRLSRRYGTLLAETGLLDKLCPQTVLQNTESVYHLYVVVCEERAALANYLSEQGIATGIYYPVPLHLQKVYQLGKHNLGYKPGDLPVSEWLCQRTLALPLFPEMTEEQQDYIMDKIQEFYSQR